MHRGACIYRPRAARVTAACALLTVALLAIWACLHPWREKSIAAVAPKDDAPSAEVAARSEAPPAVERCIRNAPPPEPAPPPARPRGPAVETVRIASGDFLMGSPDSDPDAQFDEKSRRRVKITRPFLLGKFKVTQALYQEVTGKNPSAFKPDGRRATKPGDDDSPQRPVESIRWLDAIAFCNRLSERQGLHALLSR